MKSKRRYDNSHFANRNNRYFYYKKQHKTDPYDYNFKDCKCGVEDCSTKDEVKDCNTTCDKCDYNYEHHTHYPYTPTTLREVLFRLRNELISVTTPFDTVTGTLIAVKKDYIVLVQANGSQILVPINSIELINEL